MEILWRVFVGKNLVAESARDLLGAQESGEEVGFGVAGAGAEGEDFKGVAGDFGAGGVS